MSDRALLIFFNGMIQIPEILKTYADRPMLDLDKLNSRFQPRDQNTQRKPTTGSTTVLKLRSCDLTVESPDGDSPDHLIQP